MKKRLFGRDEDGRAVEEVVLESADAAVAILSFGCVVRDWRVDGAGGSLPMVLGFPQLEDYLHHSRSHGAIVGRIANRTAGARFTLDGRTYALTRERGGAPPARRRGRARRPDLGDGDRQRRRGRSISSTQPRRRGGLSRDGRLRRHLPPRRAAADLRDGAARPTGRRRSASPTTATTTSAAAGTVQGPPALGRRATTTPRPTPTLIPTGEIRPLEGTHLDFSTEREIGDTELDHATWCSTPGRDRKRPAARASLPAHRASSSSSGPTSRACSSSTPRR